MSNKNQNLNLSCEALQNLIESNEQIQMTSEQLEFYSKNCNGEILEVDDE
ncbi:hypothetical protein [Mycoplasmopsis agassizii]|nr:hypothetical protein [Mycoplasmopsis agassizii]SMC20341.1 hypothetical protein SAMN02745179_01016 [Mycoplasmopsis agassizii]